MNTRILNRDFQHPADGWYQIEAKGLHPNRPSKIVQVIDDTALNSIVNRFQAEAARPNFPGMLIDHEHFKHDDEKETIAYGWLMAVQNRADGLYGQVRWSDTGQRAVDGGDYRFFSTEYDPKEMPVLNRDTKPFPQVRPMRLDGLTLTNVNNNKGQKPITNRDADSDADPAQAVAASKAAHDASENADTAAQHEQAASLHRKACKLQGKCGNDTTAEFHSDMSDMHDSMADRMRGGVKNRGTEFPAGRVADPASQPQSNTNEMKTVIALLGLAPDAAETAVHGAVQTVLNRNKELEGQLIESDLATYGDRFAPAQKEFIRTSLVTNRAGTLEYLKAQPKLAAATAPERVHNRGVATVHVVGHDAGQPEDTERAGANAIADGIRAIRVQNREMTYEAAHNELRRQKPELFGLKPRATAAA